MDTYSHGTYVHCVLHKWRSKASVIKSAVMMFSKQLWTVNRYGESILCLVTVI